MTTKTMDAVIKIKLGNQYGWDGELYYRGNPVCDQNQTDYERRLVAEAMKEVA